MRFFASLRMTIAAALLVISCGPRDGIRTIRTTASQEADLGKIYEIDGPVTFRLVVRNELADTLYPVQLYTPCGCTKARFDRKPVAPGEDEILEVTYDPAYRPGRMMEEIVVYYRDSPVRSRGFVIKGEVIGYLHPIEEDRPYAYGEGLYMSHKVLHFGGRQPGEKADMFFRYGNGGKKKADIRFNIPQEWSPYVRMRQPGRMKSNGRDTIHVSFTMPQNIDSVDFAIQPTVNGKITEEVLRIKAYKK